MSRDLQEPTQDREAEQKSFVEVALELSGKSADEARRTGSLDRADEQVEALFAPRYQTVNSPAHRAVWDRDLPVDLFLPQAPVVPDKVAKVMERSMEVVRRHRDAGTLMNEERKIADPVLRDLADAGYWGLLVDAEHGGQGAPFSAFAPFLTRMATIDATVAGLASVHGCIGAVDPVRTFGTPEQKARLLPKLAGGELLSGFALTEPAAGSDLTALRTTAVRDGDDYIINGEKLFITNAVPGRAVGLVCLIDDKPAVLVAELPDHENEHFQLKTYRLFALKHSYNNGLLFKDFRIPAENLLTPAKGDGLTIAYHGLNLGRVALCATASGSMRVMLANMIPWSHFRRTYGQPIAERELVQRRIGRMAALIVGCDALVAWCSWLLDQGYRGEMECIIAKIFGSEAQKEAAIELFMKTHGGRAFLGGHLFGENVHEYLAPCIYEGEGEMLGMAFLKSLIKEHGKTYFEPIGRALAESGIKKPNLANPAHLWALRGAMAPYAKWRMGQMFSGSRRAEWPQGMPKALKDHAAFVSSELAKTRMEISSTMTKHQLKLADRQCRIAEISARTQNLMIMLATSLWASRQPGELVREAADVLCQDLTRAHNGARPSDRYFKQVTKLGEAIADGGFKDIAGVQTDEILMPYANEEGDGRT